jgi:hypothetical protein
MRNRRSATVYRPMAELYAVQNREAIAWKHGQYASGST